MKSFAVMGALWIMASLVHADDARVQVLFREDRAIRPGLCSALRIQLADLARVDCVQAAGEPELAARIHATSQAAKEHDALLGLWVERDPNPAFVRMVIVASGSADEALLAVEKIEDRAAPDVDRSLALKARDTLETVLAARVQPAQVPLAVALVPREEPRSTSVLLEAGGAYAVARDPRAAGLVSVAVHHERGALYAELALTGRAFARIDDQHAGDRVSEREQDLTVGLRAGRTWELASLGALAELGITRRAAFAKTADDAEGDARFFSPRAALGFDARVWFWNGPLQLGLRFAPSLLVDPIAEHLRVEARTRMVLGRAALWLPLTMLFRVPTSTRAQ